MGKYMKITIGEAFLKGMPINDATIIYFGEPARVTCDRNCGKAWGICERPEIAFDPDEPDDIAYLADDELGEAPADPGTYEGGHGKPSSPDEFPNKWCVRQCERCEMFEPGEPIYIRVFTERVYNMPWLHVGGKNDR
jgi:hypothetical protein